MSVGKKRLKMPSLTTRQCGLRRPLYNWVAVAHSWRLTLKRPDLAISAAIASSLQKREHGFIWFIWSFNLSIVDYLENILDLAVIVISMAMSQILGKTRNS